MGIVLELTLPEFVLIDSQLLFLLVEELAVEFLAISPKLEGFVSLLEVQVSEVEDVKQDEQLLTVHAKVLLYLLDPMNLLQIFILLSLGRREHGARQIAAKSW